jgi:hypothetical protein
VDEAVKALAFAMKSDTTRDIYACMSSQSLAEQRTSKAGWDYLKPVRLAVNAVALKAFFIDIDIKDGPNGYATEALVIDAIADFLAASKLPRPTLIVGSGGGLHLYWIIDHALTPAEWKPRAVALAEMTKALGLKCDTVCTVDAARVLRVPNTFNRKNDVPRPVRLIGKTLDYDYPLEVIDEAVAPYMVVEEPPVLTPRTPLATDLDVGTLGENIETAESRLFKIEEVAANCPWIKSSLESGGENNDNALRRLVYIASTFCEEPRETAWKLVWNRETLTEEEFEHEMDRVEREKADGKAFGWPHCKTVSSFGCVDCASCPNRIANKTPFHFLTPPKPQGGNTPKKKDWDLPNGYVRESDDIVHKLVTVVDGENTRTEKVPVLDYPIINPWLQVNPYVLNFTSTPHHGATHTIAVPFAEIGAQGGARSCLMNQGIVLGAGKPAALFGEFMDSWLKKLQKAKDSVVHASPFGWSTNKNTGKTMGFTYGSLWTPDGSQPAAVADPAIAAAYTPTGVEAPWFDAAKLVTSQNKPALNAIIASAFGAPLTRFIGQGGLMFSVYSNKSGIGKTTAMKTACAVWGDPVKALQGVTDTTLSVMNRIGQLNSLPLYWDELKTEDDTKRFVNMMFDLTRGRERSRLTQTVKQRDTGSWQTMLISASNDSIIDHVIGGTKMSLAGIYRTFEVEMPNDPITTGLISTTDADKIISALNYNFGHVGMRYSQFLGANFLEVEKEVEDIRKEVELETAARNDERFWIGSIAAIMAGARYSNQLGFTHIDEAQLKAFLYETLEKMRKLTNTSSNDMTKSKNVEAVLSQYFQAMRARHTLVTNKIHIGRGAPPKNGITIVRDATRLEAVRVHIGMENKLIRLTSVDFSDWLQSRGLNRKGFMDAMAKEYRYKQFPGRIGAGTVYAATGNELLIEIDTAGTPFSEYFNSDDEAA